MPPDIAPDQSNVAQTTSLKKLVIVFGALALIVIGVLVFLQMNKNGSSNPQNNGEFDILPDLTQEQMDRRDQMRADLEKLAEENKDLPTRSEDEMRAELGKLGDESKEIPTRSEDEMRADLEKLAEESKNVTPVSLDEVQTNSDTSGGVEGTNIPEEEASN